MKSRRFSAPIIVLAALLALASLPIAADANYPPQSNPGSHTAPNPKSTVQSPKYMAPRVNPGDWPTYGHDVSRTSFNPDETTISPANVNQLTQRWQANVGNGNTPTSSSPSVSNGKVFVGSSAASGNNFFAYDAVEGGRLWGANLQHNGCLGVGIGSTSAISGTIVSVGGSDSAFYGLDTESGSIIWRHPMDLGPSAWPWASPLLAYDNAYLGMGSCADNPSVPGEVRAVNMYDGTPTASATFVPVGRRGAGVWNSPALSPDGSIMAVATGEDYQGYNGPYNRAIVALDPITLAILGAHQQGATGADQDYGTTPVIFHDSQGRTLVGANHKNGTFYAYDLTNVSAGPIWSRATGTTVGMMPAYDPTFGSGGTLFIAGGTRIFAVDPATGTDRWPMVTVGSWHGNMAIANGLIFANIGSSGLRILDETNGSTLRTIVPPGAGNAYSGVAVSHGFIYWLSGTFLNAWTLPGTPGPTNTPTVTPTITPTAPPTDTPTITPTAPPTGTPTVTPTNTPSDTPTTISTGTPANTPTDTPTGAPTNTPIAPTRTDTPTPTGTSAPNGTPTTTPTPCAITFTDVNQSDYFYEPVRYLYCRGIISGYGDGTFKPYNLTTRGQLAKIIVLAEGWASYTPPTPTFTDVPATDPFYTFVETAYNRGIISGYNCGLDCLEYRPGNNVTRAQLCKIVVLARDWPPYTPPTPTFTDVPPSDPFYTFVETAYAHTIISGYQCGPSCLEFRPGNNATRGQICKIVYIAVTTP